jgi:predicted nucleic-acid-binding Zn-ribbon protein
MPEKYKRKPNTECLICQKPIYKRRVEIKRNEGRIFCSMACYGISRRKEKPCLVCGSPILAGANKKTCSRSCANKHRAGIKYKLNRPRDKVTSYQFLKVRLSKQRGKVCERCGYNKYEILQVHHKNRDRINNNLENLELICPNCHYEEHYLRKIS